MKRSKFFKAILVSSLSPVVLLSSCEKYLDKAPSADISAKDVFGNFVSFQGWVEEMYNCETDYSKVLGGNYFYNFLCGDEVLGNKPLLWDDGNYWDQGKFLTGSLNTNNHTMSKRVWPLSWYAIRKANIGLANMDLLTNATQQQKDFIKGQCLFFRGFYYFDLMRFWGGLPYIDAVLTTAATRGLPRLSYKETTLKAVADLKAAAALLPAIWDSTETGKPTLGNNQSRITKIHALSYLGKALLFAASPMMNESSTGNASYDQDLCKQAAQAFADVINTCNETGAYKLQSWDSWTDNFWVWSPGERTRSGGTEVIMNPTIYDISYSRWTTCRTSSPVQFNAGNNQVEVPTANYIKYYGMANGLPIDDPNSGFDPTNPWANRDPRFYKDIVVDGDRMVTSNAAGPDQYAQLYNGGRHKGGTRGSVTGFYYKRWTPVGCNPWDNKWGNFQAYMPYMRLGDVYLMYAEAVLQGYGSSSASVPGCITAEKAVNIIRNRAQIPDLTSKYTATKDAFMDSIILERAVELGFEGHRWDDLRRWNLAGELKYKQKTALDFDRGPDGKPINIRERVVLTKVFDKRNNWLPFQVSDTKLSKGFTQNPGW
jgi:hypothetical protein